MVASTSCSSNKQSEEKQYPKKKAPQDITSELERAKGEILDLDMLSVNLIQPDCKYIRKPAQSTTAF